MFVCVCVCVCVYVCLCECVSALYLSTVLRDGLQLIRLCFDTPTFLCGNIYHIG